MIDLKKRILGNNKEDLAEIETQLAENLKPYLNLVSEVAHHILFAGGKRLRPLLLVLAAKICGYTETYAKKVASAMEYLHAATLLHDDVIDDAMLRRGKTVAHSVYGNAITILVGDFLLSRALAICADSGKIEVMRIVADLTEHMSTGEVHQLMRKGDVSLSEDEYMEVIRRKTAVLFQAACKVSAVIAEATPETLKALSRIPGMTAGQMRRYGNGVLQTVQRGRHAKYPKPPKSNHVDDRILDRYEKLHSWRKKTARKRGLESDVILPRDMLWDIARTAPRDLENLERIMAPLHWRYNEYGDQILKTLWG